jgi:hypothetical protein
VLLPVAGPLAEADERLAERALGAVDGAVALVPDDWLGPDPGVARTGLRGFLERRLAEPRRFVEEAERARR